MDFVPTTSVSLASFSMNASTLATVRLKTAIYPSHGLRRVKGQNKHLEAVVVHVENEVLAHDGEPNQSKITSSGHFFT